TWRIWRARPDTPTSRTCHGTAAPWPGRAPADYWPTVEQRKAAGLSFVVEGRYRDRAVADGRPLPGWPPGLRVVGAGQGRNTVPSKALRASAASRPDFPKCTPGPFRRFAGFSRSE